MKSRVLFALVALIALPSPVRAERSGQQIDSEAVPAYRAADPSAAAVTSANLVASERFWPYQVALTRKWQPPGGARPLASGSVGVLIRVEASGHARIDFGRDGLYEVPIASTDLVQRANGVRLGRLEKDAPNFVWAMLQRLGDSASQVPRPFPYRDGASERGFLAVFADPSAPEFDDLVAALAPLRDRDGVLTLFFPQGRHSDEAVRDQLRASKWTVPFVLDHLAETYTRILLPEGISPPAITLQTSEGRLLFQSAWGPGAAANLRAALDEAFGGTTAAAASTR
jgi:hypothetical protein